MTVAKVLHEMIKSVRRWLYRCEDGELGFYEFRSNTKRSRMRMVGGRTRMRENVSRCRTRAIV